MGGSSPVVGVAVLVVATKVVLDPVAAAVVTVVGPAPVLPAQLTAPKISRNPAKGSSLLNMTLPRKTCPAALARVRHLSVGRIPGDVLKGMPVVPTTLAGEPANRTIGESVDGLGSLSQSCDTKIVPDGPRARPSCAAEMPFPEPDVAYAVMPDPLVGGPRRMIQGE
jgi:hypothetical protein